MGRKILQMNSGRVKSTIKQMLRKQTRNFLGLDITKSRPVPRLSDETESSVIKSIELIGATGVGKSTILNNMPADLSANWYIDSRPKDFDVQGVEEVHCNALRQALVSSVYEVIAQRTESAPIICKSMRHRVETMLADTFMNSLTFDRPFLLSEGVCHNFLDALLEAFDCDHPELDEFFAKRSFVAVIARDPSWIVKNIQKRRRIETWRTGSAELRLSTFPGFSDERLLQFLSARNEAYMKFTDRVTALGCPALVLYAEDGIEQNVSRFTDFEQKLRIRDFAISAPAQATRQGGSKPLGQISPH